MDKQKLFLWVLITAFFTWIALPRSVVLPLVDKKITLRPKELKLKIFGQELKINDKLLFGLDLQGGTRLVFELDTSKINKKDLEKAVEATRNIIEKRVNFFGTQEPLVLLLKNKNSYRISVDLPGNKNPHEAAAVIGKTAQLRFAEYKFRKEKQATETAKIPYFSFTNLTGSYLKKAELVFDPQTGNPQVSLSFNKKGAEIFAKLTKKNINKPLAIFLDNSLLTAPIVQSEIKNGVAVITGKFSVKEAKEMVFALNAGALPVPTRVVEQKTIEASLGEQNIKKSLFAGLVGLFSVALFMLVFYLREGLVAVVSLFLYTIYSLGIYKLFGIVLTLPGIAGFILSVGMAVDANILIYERIKEEKIKLADPRTAIKIGFFKALGAIREANINTLLVCFVLFNPLNFSILPQFGLVRGFAITLAIGVLLGLFTGVFVTKAILWQLYKINTKQ